MTYKIIREDRKTATIRINQNLDVIVKIPRFMTQRHIDELLKKHQKWIEEAVYKREQFIRESDWLLNKKLLFLGEHRSVIFTDKGLQKESVIFEGGCFYVSLLADQTQMRINVERFFRKEAKDLLTSLTKKYAEKIDVEYNKITIRKQTTRWGSCSINRNLSYNVQILCAPIPMIEYIVLHEVMHLKHFNHSKEFWQDIGRIMPDYKERMNYFKQFGQNFMI